MLISQRSLWPGPLTTSPWDRHGAPASWRREEGGKAKCPPPPVNALYLLLLEPSPEIPRDPGQAVELETTAAGGRGGRRLLHIYPPPALPGTAFAVPDGREHAGPRGDLPERDGLVPTGPRDSGWVPAPLSPLLSPSTSYPHQPLQLPLIAWGNAEPLTSEDLAELLPPPGHTPSPSSPLFWILLVSLCPSRLTLTRATSCGWGRALEPLPTLALTAPSPLTWPEGCHQNVIPGSVLPLCLSIALWCSPQGGGQRVSRWRGWG